MPDYLDIATRAAEYLEPDPSKWALLGMSGQALIEWMDELADTSCMDLQVAMDNAMRTKQQTFSGQQLDLMRMAA